MEITKRERGRERGGGRGRGGYEIYGIGGCAFLVNEVNLGSKVDFVVESGLHVLTSRTTMHQYQRQLSFALSVNHSLSLSFSYTHSQNFIKKFRY